MSNRIGRWRRASWMLLVVVSGLLCSCVTVEKASKNQKRHLQFQSYDHTVRWGDLEEMYGYMKPGDAPPAVQEGLDNIRVTSYEPLGPVYDLDGGRASRKVRIEYVLKDRQVVKTLIDEQLWEYDPELEQWFRVNSPPEFR